MALCGFHDGKSRRLIDKAKFDLVVEAGLGAEITDFDQVSIHMFPNKSFRPEDVWSMDAKINRREDRIAKFGGACGAIELAEKAVSTSFVGATASALVWAEVLRQYHKGCSFSRQNTDLRSLSDMTARIDEESCCSRKIAIRGYSGAGRK